VETALVGLPAVEEGEAVTTAAVEEDITTAAAAGLLTSAELTVVPRLLEFKTAMVKLLYLGTLKGAHLL
jgi:hypothetical protein